MANNFLCLCSPTAKMWQQTSGYSITRMVLSKRQGWDAALSVATEVTLVTNHGQLCNASLLIRGVLAVCQWWQQEERWASGVPLQVLSPSPLLFTGTSKTGWALHLQDLNAAEIWAEDKINLHISIVKMKPVQLALNAFRDRIKVEYMAWMSDIARVVTYIKKQGGTVSWVMCDLAQGNLTWVEQFTICSDRILTFGIRSIRSPAKVGLVITKLLTTSPVVSWRGWETPPPPQAPRLNCHCLLNHS